MFCGQASKRVSLPSDTLIHLIIFYYRYIVYVVCSFLCAILVNKLRAIYCLTTVATI